MVAILSLFILSLSYSSDISNDSLSVLIEDKTDLILDEVRYIDPLKGKKIGIEINPLYTMFLDEGFSLSGSFSNFTLSDKAEIAFPFNYTSYKSNNSIKSYFYIDAHYRLFLGKHRNGKYIMTGLRIYSGEDNQGSYNKAGISFGFGERFFSTKKWYWGSSIYLGKYYWGDADRGGSSFFDAEFLKFGFIF